MTEPSSAATAHAAPDDRPRTRQRVPKAASRLGRARHCTRRVGEEAGAEYSGPTSIPQENARGRVASPGRATVTLVFQNVGCLRQRLVAPSRVLSLHSFLRPGDSIEQVADQGWPSTSEVDDATAGFNLDASAVWSTDPSDSDSMSELLYGTQPTVFGACLHVEPARVALPRVPLYVPPCNKHAEALPGRA
ncbi:hypothetical protein LZ30DRAFT_389482 [Colletotrichum cereale]|nr:hypothetical protein LZ30DRAFT_389482 [Colletotrichum cereale]